MGKNSGLSDTTASIKTDADALTQIAQTQSGRADQLFQESNPGMISAENFYGTLASGDPYAIARAVAPQTSQINQATAGAKANIMNTTPSGGEKNLALEQADVSQGAQVGQVSSGAVSSAYNALAQLAGQGTGESISSAGTGISGFSAANQGLGQLGNLQIEQKGAQLGAMTSLGRDAANLAGMFMFG